MDRKWAIREVIRILWDITMEVNLENFRDSQSQVFEV